MIREKQAAQDLVQELFITIWNKAANIQPGSNLAGYLYVAAQNSALLYIRKGKFKNDYLTSLSSYHDEIADVIVDEDDLEQMRSMVNKAT